MAKSKPPRPDPADAALTDAEERFVNEYMHDLNMVRAYQAAVPGTGARAAKRQAQAMRELPHVKAEIAARRHDAKIRCGIRADNVLREWARIAFSDISLHYGPDDRLLPTGSIPLDQRRAIQSVKVRRERVTTRRISSTRKGPTTTTTDVTTHEMEIEVKLYDKLAALQRLGAFLGLADSLPDLERLLLALPPQLAEQVRAMLGAATSGSPTKALPGG